MDRLVARRPCRGFTLAELLVAIAVSAAIAALLLPCIQKTREASARSSCQYNLQRLALAAHTYHDVKSRFPAGETVTGDPHLGRLDGEYYACWVIPLLPHIGEAVRAQELRRLKSFEERHRGGRSSAYGAPMRLLLCPSDALPGGGQYEYRSPDPANPTYGMDYPDGRYDALCSYGANWGTHRLNPYQPGPRPEGADGVFHYNTRTRFADVTDGASCTILFGERSHSEPRWRFMGLPYPSQQEFAVFARWYTGGLFTGRLPLEAINYRLPLWVEGVPPRPHSPDWNDLFTKRLGSYGSEHPGGCNLALADGSVRFVSHHVTVAALQALATKSGGERVFQD